MGESKSKYHFLCHRSKSPSSTYDTSASSKKVIQLYSYKVPKKKSGKPYLLGILKLPNAKVGIWKIGSNLDILDIVIRVTIVWMHFEGFFRCSTDVIVMDASFGSQKDFNIGFPNWHDTNLANDDENTDGLVWNPDLQRVIKPLQFNSSPPEKRWLDHYFPLRKGTTFQGIC